MHTIVHKTSRFDKKKIERKFARNRSLSQSNVLGLLTEESHLQIVKRELANTVAADGTIIKKGRKDAKVEKHEKSKAYNIMQDLIWNTRSLDRDFKETVVEEVYKYDCKIGPGEKYKIKMVTDKLRQQSREKNWEKEVKKGHMKTNEIWKKKEKIRALKARLAEEQRLMNLPVREITFAERTTLKPLKDAETRVKFMKSIFEHIENQKEIPRVVKRQTNKIPPSCESGGPTLSNNAGEEVTRGSRKAIAYVLDKDDRKKQQKRVVEKILARSVTSVKQANIEFKAICDTLREKEEYYRKEEKELSILEKELREITQGKVTELHKKVKVVNYCVESLENLLEKKVVPLKRLESCLFVKVSGARELNQEWLQEITKVIQKHGLEKECGEEDLGKMVSAAEEIIERLVENRNELMLELSEVEEGLEEEKVEIEKILESLNDDLGRTRGRKEVLENIIREDERKKADFDRVEKETERMRLRLLEEQEAEEQGRRASSVDLMEALSPPPSPTKKFFHPFGVEAAVDARKQKRQLIDRIEGEKMQEAQKKGHQAVMIQMIETTSAKRARHSMVRTKPAEWTVKVKTLSPSHRSVDSNSVTTMGSEESTVGIVDDAASVASGEKIDVFFTDPGTPRQRYIKKNAITKIQKVFRGTQARYWVDNQATRLFPLHQTNRNFLEGGNRSRAIFLERKRLLLLNSQERLQPELDRWNREKEELEKKIEKKTIKMGRKRNKTIVANLKTNQMSSKRRLNQYQVQKYLDLEASQLQKNLRFVAACVIQHYCSNYVQKKFPHLKTLIKKNKRKREIMERHALIRNQSNKEYEKRRFEKAKQAASRFGIIPIIVRMQRDWREYLSIKHSKREIEAAVRLLKRMRENAKNGAELFKQLKDEHRRDILLAVDYNVLLRNRFVKRHFQAFRDWSDDRLRRKKWLYDRLLKRKVGIIEIWFAEIMISKRNFINKVKPVMFPPLLAVYIRYTRDNDWETLLQEISDLYCEFDKNSRVSSLEFETFTTNKVVGFKSKLKELNEMLGFHIGDSDMRKKPIFVVNKDESQMSLSFWEWLHRCSCFLWSRSRDLMRLNVKQTTIEERGVVDGLLWQFLMKANLNPHSLSAKFRLKSTNFLKWRGEEELCKECVAIITNVNGVCDVCGSKQLPRYMRKTETTHCSTAESDGVRDFSDGGKFSRSLRGLMKFGKVVNVVSTVADINDTIDLFLVQSQMACLAPVGGWRRSHTVEEVWSYSARTARETVHRLKRRGVLSIGDLYRCSRGEADATLEEFMGGDKNRQLCLKVRSLLKMLEESLEVCLKEEHTVEDVRRGKAGVENGTGGTGGTGGESVSMFKSKYSSDAASSNMFLRRTVTINRERVGNEKCSTTSRPKTR